MAKKSLLLVDADSKSLRMLEVSLRKSGFSVTTAIHAADARDKLKHSAPDLIITDTKLPGDENGFDLVANLKAQPETANIPIIFLSSENRLEQKVTGLELGVEDYLTKPIYIKEVLTRVRVLLDKREKQTLERRERSSSFSGLLGDMGLVDLMQTVEIGRKTGHLNIETRGQRGQVSFKEGKVTNARSGRLTGERAFYRMLVWNEGMFSMEFGAYDEADVIELSTQGLLMEGMRRVDEWGRLIEQLPPLDHIFEIDFNELVERLAEIPDEINLLLRLFDGRRTMLGVVDETDFGDLEALEIASKLYFEGLIFDVSDREPVAPSQPHKVEAWLSEPAGASDDDGDDDDAQLLIPSNADTLPPMPAPGLSAPAPATPSAAVVAAAPAAAATRGGILAPPSGAASTAPPLVSSTVPSIPPPRTTTAKMAAATVLPPRSDPIEMAVEAPRAPTPRPLPAPATDEPETRAVVSRNAVGATAWSSAKKGQHDDDDDEWEDIVAPDESATPIEGLLSAVSAPPPPPLLPLTSSGVMSAPPPPTLGPVVEPLTLTPTTSAVQTTPAAGPVPETTGAKELARDLGLSDDELALALSAHDDAAFAENTPTALEGDAADEGRGLADSIAAQLDPPSLPPELLTRPEFPDNDALGDTDKGGRRKKPPTPAPHTLAPSTKPVVHDTDPGGPGVALNAANDDGIHDQRTQLDIEPLVVERFGVSKPMAAVLVIIGIAVAFAVVVAVTEKPPEAVAEPDAGAAVAVVVDAGIAVAVIAPIVDAGSAIVAPVVVDAGSALVIAPAIVDAGTAEKPIVDAGQKAVVVVAPIVDAGPKAVVVVAPIVDAGPKAVVVVAPDPLAGYAGHLKAGEAATKRGEFSRSVRSYKAALAIEKDSIEAHLGLGNAYYELDNLAAALFHLERARALSPKDPQVFVHLGAVYQSSGRKGDAISAYERYLDLAPDGKFARDVRGILRGLKN
ncbi:MAG: DUF4388 domain-containing protein [Deltaproteobacteria bacterium]|nr:DUF4388 domain-containing protein [Deltaproteobacteria bacterium]